MHVWENFMKRKHTKTEDPHEQNVSKVKKKIPTFAENY